MKKLIYSGLIIMLVIFGINNIIAQPRSGKNFKKDRCFEKLNLTDAQKVKFKEIRFNFQDAKIDLEAMTKKNRLEVKKLMTSDNFDKNTLIKFIDKGSDLRAQQKKSRVQMWLDIRDILNDDQKKIWVENFSSFQNGKNHSFGKGGKNGKRLLLNDCDINSGKNQRRIKN